MHALIEQHREQIAELCRRHRVRRLEVFGSAARGVDFDPATSDADFLVSFEAPAGRSTLDEDIALTQALEALLGRPVELVKPELIANPFILAGVNSAREVVFGA